MEKLKGNIEYSQYIAESVNNNTTGKTQIHTSVNESINEGKRTSGFSGDYTSLSSKVDMLIESVSNNKTEEIINENKYSFLKLVDENTKKGFISLNEAEKQKVVKALNEQNYNSGTEVVQIMGSALTEQVNSGEKFLDMMPASIIPAWEAMNENQKSAIIAQSKTHRLETPYQINHFWATRGISTPAANLERLNESQEAPNTAVSNSYMENLKAELEKRFKK